MFPEPGISFFVFLLTCFMLPAIQFDNDSISQRDEIYNVRTDGLLSTEFNIVDPPCTEISPEQLFYIC